MRNLLCGLIALLPFLVTTPASAYLITVGSTGAPQNGFGFTDSGTNYYYVAEPFTTSAAGTVASTSIYIDTNGTPAGTIAVSIQADSGGVPSGTDLGTSNSISFSGSCQYAKFTWSSPVSVSATTKYWAKMVPSATAPTAANYYDVCSGTTGLGSDPRNYRFVDTTWNALGNLGGLLVDVTIPSPSTNVFIPSMIWW